MVKLSRIIKSFSEFINEMSEYHATGSLDHDYIRINVHAMKSIKSV